MFEYHFHGLNDGHGTFVHTGATHDFLEVCSQIAQLYSHQTAGDFVRELLGEKEKELSFLRVIDWNFEYVIEPPEGVGEIRKIELRKLR